MTMGRHWREDQICKGIGYIASLGHNLSRPFLTSYEVYMRIEKDPIERPVMEGRLCRTVWSFQTHGSGAVVSIGVLNLFRTPHLEPANT